MPDLITAIAWFALGMFAAYFVINAIRLILWQLEEPLDKLKWWWRDK